MADGNLDETEMSDMQSERARQGQALYEIVRDAVYDYGERQVAPTINAVISALTANLGQALATMPEPYRSRTRDSVCEMLAEYQDGEGLGQVVLVRGKGI